LFAGMNRSAVFALAQAFVAVELLENWRKISNNAFQSYFGTVQQLMAILTIPLERVDGIFRTRHLDDYADATRLPLRRMPHVRR
jgi:hypothetical protein